MKGNRQRCSYRVGELREERPSEEAHPMEGLMSEEEERAEDTVWPQVAFQNHLGFSAGEILSQRLDRSKKGTGRRQRRGPSFARPPLEGRAASPPNRPTVFTRRPLRLRQGTWLRLRVFKFDRREEGQKLEEDKAFWVARSGDLYGRQRRTGARRSPAGTG